MRSRLYLVPFGEIQQQVVLAVPGADARRRLPAADAAHRASGSRSTRARRRSSPATSSARWRRRRSRTWRSIGAVATLPVFRPLIGMDKEEITAEAQRLGTYPISIMPDQDCCTLFTPRHPATKARADGHRGGGAGAADRRSGAAGGRQRAVVEDFEYPVIK